jgi:hypothetical protein
VYLERAGVVRTVVKGAQKVKKGWKGGGNAVKVMPRTTSAKGPAELDQTTPFCPDGYDRTIPIWAIWAIWAIWGATIHFKEITWTRVVRAPGGSCLSRTTFEASSGGINALAFIHIKRKSLV